MKGLLLKDFYMILKYCRAYLIIIAVFILASFLVNDDNLFFVFYPCLFSGMLPVNLISYDERSKWNEYSGTLPYSKSQIVSGKYIIGLIVQIIVFILTGIAQAVRMNMNGNFELNDYLAIIVMILFMSCVSSSISLPFIFKWGVEKGRLANFVTIGFIFAGSLIASKLFESDLQTEVTFNVVILTALCILGIAIFAFSWYLSTVFYKKRETK